MLKLDQCWKGTSGKAGQDRIPKSDSRDSSGPRGNVPSLFKTKRACLAYRPRPGLPQMRGACLLLIKERGRHGSEAGRNPTELPKRGARSSIAMYISGYTRGTEQPPMTTATNRTHKHFCCKSHAAPVDRHPPSKPEAEPHALRCCFWFELSMFDETHSAGAQSKTALAASLVFAVSAPIPGRVSDSVEHPKRKKDAIH